MAITTTLQPKYAFRYIAVGIVSLVLGLWGVYDYMYAIPLKQRNFERGEVFRAVDDAVDEAVLYARRESTDRELVKSKIQVANGDVDRMLEQASTEINERLVDVDPNNLTEEERQELQREVQSSGPGQWFATLIMLKAALYEADRLSPGSQPSPFLLSTREKLKEGVTEASELTAPSTFDRLSQWMFIACLLFVPYAIWILMKTKKRTFSLEDDGTLRTPEETIPPSDIADIDMSRWMAKSVAYVETSDARRIKLDDYLHKNMHLIVGALVSERYPEKWNDDATIKKDEPETNEPEPNEPAAPAAGPD